MSVAARCEEFQFYKCRLLAFGLLAESVKGRFFGMNKEGLVFGRLSGGGRGGLGLEGPSAVPVCCAAEFASSPPAMVRLGGTPSCISRFSDCGLGEDEGLKLACGRNVSRVGSREVEGEAEMLGARSCFFPFWLARKSRGVCKFWRIAASPALIGSNDFLMAGFAITVGNGRSMVRRWKNCGSACLYLLHCPLVVEGVTHF